MSHVPARDPRIELHAELRRAHAQAAKALAAFGRYQMNRPSPHPLRSAMVAMSVEGIHLLHAVMGRAEKAIRDDLDDETDGRKAA